MNHPAIMPELLAIPVADLQPSPTNPRRIDDKHPSLPGLAESIKGQGVIEPLIVRPRATEAGELTGYEILAGERRWRASRLAGLETVPCLVRHVDDQAAFEITVTENLQREDLHWLEEARGVELMVKKGWDVEAIAKHIGKSPAWVHLRAKLAKISPKWLKAVEDPRSDYHGWPAARLELIARFPHQLQDDLLQPGNWWLRNAQTVEHLRKEIDKHLLQRLSTAPWSIDDAKLVPKAGACSACPKRSSCQQHLFESTDGDRCTDAGCWQSKMAAHTQVRLKELREQHPGLQLAAKDYEARVQPELFGVPKKEQVHDLDGYGMKAATKDEKGAAPYYVVDTGSVVWRKKVSHSNGREATPGPSAAERKKKAAEILTRKRTNQVIERFVEQLEKHGEVLIPDATVFLAFVASWGFDVPHWGADGAKQAMKDFAARRKKPEKELLDVLWRHVRDTIVGRVTPAHLDTGPIGVVEDLCQLFGGKWVKDFADWQAAALKEFPLPAAPKVKAKAKAKATKPAKAAAGKG